MSTMFDILNKILGKPAFKEKDRILIKEAFLVAKEAHQNQKRSSGELYINHPLKVAFFLSELGLDSTTIASCLLHDTIEDTSLTRNDLEKKFGKEIAFLVDGVTKLSKIEYSNKSGVDKKSHTDHLNSLKKMIFAMAEDIRVILIKLADRYHNMETLKYLDKTAQNKVALETLEIYAPIAARLGMGRLKGQLEDLAFPYVYPNEYSQLLKKVKNKYRDVTKYIDRTKPLIKRHLTNSDIPLIDMHSRAKHYFSLYQKIKRQNKDLDKIYDLVAMRIIVPDIKSCYEALGVIHNHYKPLPGLIKDYIALPKPNGYQSLHTTIFCEKGKIVELQIRTEDMHEFAENGIAAHWAYSESGKFKPTKANAKEIQWVTQLKKMLKELNPGEELTNIKIDFFKNRIFAFTPKGDVKDLPEGATPVDFAYSIHSDLGHLIKGAKINGKIATLNHELKNGDVIEIMKGKEKKPSFDWLKFVKTAEAKKRIKSWFKERSSESETVEIKKIQAPKKKNIIIADTKGEPIIQGQQGLLYKFARCCNPTINHKIKGYMTINRGVSIHTANCSNIKNAPSLRILTASWKK